MPTESSHPLHASRMSISAAVAACGLFAVLVIFLREPAAPVQPDLSGVAESDQWKYTSEGRTKHLSSLRASEAGQLGSYAWIDQAKGVVRLPVDRAMELVVLEHQAR